MAMKVVVGVLGIIAAAALWTIVHAEDAKPQDRTLAFKKGQVLSVIAVKTSKEEAETFVKAFTEGPKASHKMKGFLGLAVSENIKEPASFLVISLWENEDALNGYVKSKAFGEDHARMMEIKSAKTEMPARYVVKED
jgi:heme-degrading monooxygenase HmoA